MSALARSLRFIFGKKSAGPTEDGFSAEMRRWKKEHVGRNCYIDPTVQVLGWKNVRIGPHTTIGEDSWLNVNHREKEEPAIIIGANCFIARRNFFSAGALIRLGPYCFSGPDCRFLGAHHLFDSPFVPYIKSGVTETGVMEVGANCCFGANVTVLGQVNIGFGSVLGASAVVTRDVPPFSLAVGNPARVLRRFDVQKETWVKLDEYPADGDRQLPTEAQYLAQLERDFPKCRGPKIAASKLFGDL